MQKKIEGPSEQGRPPSGDDLSLIDRVKRVLANPIVLRGLIGLTAGVIVLRGVNVRNEFLRAVFVGLLISYALTETYRAVREHRGTGRWPNPSAPVVAGALAVYILIFGDRAGEFLGLALGVGLFTWGAVEVVRGLRRRETSRDWSWLVVKGLISLTTGLIALSFPSNTVFLIFAAIAIAWVLVGGLAIWYGITNPAGAEGRFDAYVVVSDWFNRRDFTKGERQRVVDTLFYEGPAARTRLYRFAVLMALSVTIASLGVIQDSTAVVIGAMLIAPLMTPIMATSAGIIMGWPQRATQAALTVLAGAVGAIALSFFMAEFLPAVVSLTDNSQIVSRTSPTLIDLLIALAAGTAGAFAISRQDVSDSLPGVAIAVALVPPLSVVGVTLSRGAYDDALGALLLFTTNLVCVILSGAIVFVMVGFTPITHLRRRVASIRVVLGTVVIGVLVVAIPLATTSVELLREASYARAAEAATRTWISEESDARLLAVDVDGTEITVNVGGPEEPPSIEQLAGSIEDELGSDDFTLYVEWILAESERYPE